MEKIPVVKEKVYILKEIDKNCEVPGSFIHEYELRECLKEDKIKMYEERFNIVFPEDYKNYLMFISDGGAGPGTGISGIGLLDLNNKAGVYTHIEAFKFTSKWDLPENSTPLTEEERKELVDGTIFITRDLESARYLLVVNGEEKGNMWIDKTEMDGGLEPVKSADGKARVTFLEWFEEWLDESIRSLKPENRFYYENSNSNIY